MFEIALAEWHIDPAAILERWTWRLLCLMIRKRNERIEGMSRAQEGGAYEPPRAQSGGGWMSLEQFARKKG